MAISSGHDHDAPPDFDRLRGRHLRFAIGLTGVVFVGELIGGFWTGSLALLSDAGHVFSDVLSLALTLFAVGLACRPPTDRHSYGLHRTEVFAALANGLSLVVICLLIFYEAYQRLLTPPAIKSLEMLAIALVGLVGNWVVAVRLGGHGHDDLNLRSAYLHVLGDLLASVGVVIAALVIRVTGWTQVDPLLSAGIGLFILGGAVRVIGQASHILLEGVPPGVDLEALAAAMVAVEEVKGVHHVHAWNICSNIRALSAHVVTCPETEAERAAIRTKLEHILSAGFGFTETTLEFECEPCCEDGLLCSIEHRAAAGHAHHDHPHA